MNCCLESSLHTGRGGGPSSDPLAGESDLDSDRIFGISDGPKSCSQGNAVAVLADDESVE